MVPSGLAAADDGSRQGGVMKTLYEISCVAAGVGGSIAFWILLNVMLEVLR